MNIELNLFDQQKEVFSSVQNRNDNYYKMIMPELTHKEDVVYRACIRIKKPSTMHEVAKFLGVELNTISGRFSKLCEKGKLKIIGKTPNKRSIYEVQS